MRLATAVLLVALPAAYAQAQAQAEWVRTAGSPNAFASADGVSALPDGAVAVVGGQALTVYEPSGATRFSRPLAGTELVGVVAGPAGELYLAGTYSSPLDLDGDGAADLPAAVGEFGFAPFAARLTPAGGLAWGRPFRVVNGSGAPIYGVAADASGLVLAGYTDGALDLSGDGQPDVTAGIGQDPFVARFAPGGALVWARAVTGPSGFDSFRAAALAPSGEVVVGGFFTGNADFTGDGQPEIAAEGGGQQQTNAFVAQYAPDGTFRSARAISAVAVDGLGVTASGAVLASGQLSAFLSGDFDGDGQPDVTPANGGFVARYDATGALVWARAFTGENAPQGQSSASVVALTADGEDALVGGSFQTRLSVAGAPVLTATDASDGFLVRLSAAGAAGAALGLGGPGAAFAADITTLPGGAVAASGGFSGTVDLTGDGTAEGTAVGSFDAFVVRYAPGLLVAAEDEPEPSSSLRLEVPVPNPTSGVAHLPLTLEAPASVRVEVVDALGRVVAVAVDGPLAAGPHRIRLDTRRLPAGLYVARATASGTPPVRVLLTVVR